MRAETVAGTLGVAGLLVSALVALQPASLPAVRQPAQRIDFPPAPRQRLLEPAAHGGLPAVMGLDAEVARIGRSGPRFDALRRAFHDAPNLMQFALERLPRASAGDGASQYFLYLALDQCRSYLRRDFESSSANLERLTNVPDLNSEELAAWRSDLERCRAFAVSDWSALVDALGDDAPGAEVEVGSVWFERATLSGYPPAVAELALRPGPYDTPMRHQFLEQALAGGGADVSWLLFAHSGDVAAGEVSLHALAWLIVACRAGQDCTEEARWYRNFACTNGEGRCAPGQSALEHYWFMASADDRDRAWTLASRIESAMRAQAWADLPLPELDGLDYRRRWGETQS